MKLMPDRSCGIPLKTGILPQPVNSPSFVLRLCIAASKVLVGEAGVEKVKRQV